jgi:hypothetical protein
VVQEVVVLGESEKQNMKDVLFLYFRPSELSSSELSELSFGSDDPRRK